MLSSCWQWPLRVSHRPLGPPSYWVAQSTLDAGSSEARACRSEASRRKVTLRRPWEHRGPGVQRAPSPVGSRAVRNAETPSRSGRGPAGGWPCRYTDRNAEFGGSEMAATDAARMQALRAYARDDPAGLRYEETDVPAPGIGDVLLRVAVASFTPTELAGIAHRQFRGTRFRERSSPSGTVRPGSR